MHDHQRNPDVPEITAVPKAFCARHCAAWIVRKGKRGDDLSVCGRIYRSPKEWNCGWTWAEIRRRLA